MKSFFMSFHVLVYQSYLSGWKNKKDMPENLTEIARFLATAE